jgi:hypothetical protein
MKWRPGVVKLVTVMGDAPAKDPDHAGKTKDSIADLAFKVDPAHVYALACKPDAMSDFRAMAEKTGGKAFAVSDAAKLPGALESLIRQAVAEHEKEMTAPPAVLSPAIEITGGGGGTMPDNSGQVYLLLAVAGCGLMLALITAVTLKRRPPHAEAVLPPPWMVTIREPGTASRAATIRATAVRVGRGPGNQLQLADPQVSGAHLQIQRGPQGFLVRDLGSNNGVWVGPRRVIEPVVVPPGTSIRLGNTTLTLNS